MNTPYPQRKDILSKGQVSSILLSIILFFYILSVASFFNPIVYPLIDRVTYTTPFADKYFFGSYIDKILTLLMASLWFFLAIKHRSRYGLALVYILTTIFATLTIYPAFTDILLLLIIPLIFSFVLLNKIFKSRKVIFQKHIFIYSVSLIGIIFGSLSLVISFIQISAPNLVLPSINYFYYFYLVLSIFSPILLIIIAFSFPLKIVTNKISKFRFPMDNALKVLSRDHSDLLSVKKRILCLIGIIILSSLIVWIPHIYSVNSDNQIIGSDTKDYENLLLDMNSSTTIQEFISAFISQLQEDRSLSLITFYFLSQVVNPSDVVAFLEFLPFILAPLLILTIYYLTMELTASHITSITSSFMSAVSFQLLIGMYGGFYANWFTLIFVNLAFVYLIRSLRIPSKHNLIIFSALLVVVLFSHESTWPIVTLVIFIFIISLLLYKLSLKVTISYLVLALFPSVIVESFKSIIMRQSGVIQNLSFASNQGLGVHDALTIWNNLVVTTQTYLAGQFNNSIVYGLVLYWVSRCDLRDKSNLLLLLFLSIITFPFLFGDPEVLGRVLYEIPFQIPAAIALVQLKKNHGNLIFLSLCLWLIALAIRSSANFYFDT